MNAEISRFDDASGDRKLTLRAPEGHEVSGDDIELMSASFAEEREAQPDTLKGVVIDRTRGRLAIEIFASGAEAALHQSAKRWGGYMYPGADSAPLGHEWSIDMPANMRSIVIE